MKIRVTYIAAIPDQDLTDEGIDPTDVEAVADFFFEDEDSYYDYGENFEILKE